MKPLSELLAKAGIAGVAGVGEVRVGSITTDSRKAMPHSLYIAVPGVSANGAEFIPDALKAGASAIVCSETVAETLHADVPIIGVADVRAAVAALAAAFYPNMPAFMVAVTGTDGKTSTADFTRQLFTLSGNAAASFGTLGLISPLRELNAAFPANNTSPEPILLHRTLQQLAEGKVQHVAMEASSHGIDQKRLDGVKLRAAAFTNLSRDHLDYHGTMEAYFAAKQRLFDTLLPAGATAVLAADMAHFAAVEAVCTQRGHRILSFGRNGNDYRIISITPHALGLSTLLQIHGKEYTLDLPLYGEFQVYNMLTALGLAEGCGLDAHVLMAQLPKLQGVRGRLERVAELKNGAVAFVDYAHTPAALEKILRCLRPHTQGKLRVVFGCGGDRDTGKRPEMGKVAIAHADHVIVTDDNPRSESPAAIRRAILAAAPGAEEIDDRKRAILHAVAQCEEGDVLVVAGKGHEETQIIGSETIPFSDAKILREAA